MNITMTDPGHLQNKNKKINVKKEEKKPISRLDGISVSGLVILVISQVFVRCGLFRDPTRDD